MSLRFDYLEEGEAVNVTVVSINGDTHSLAGRLVFTKQEWQRLQLMLMMSVSGFFICENKRQEKTQ